MKSKELPLEIKIDKAINKLRFTINQIASDYELPGVVMEVILESVLCKEKSERISYMAEQINIDDKEKEDGKHQDPPK